jgi:hypothetical protein
MAVKPSKRKAYEALLQTLDKRPRAVLEKILENGSVSTYELGLLGYDQPPRAAQDLKENGVRLRVEYAKHPKTKHRMAVYSLAPDDDPVARLAGRRAFPSKFRQDVLDAQGQTCNLCNCVYPMSSLQLDHRIPYIIGGEAAELRVADFQLLCGSHQRKKSWECEHCPNRERPDAAVCRQCFWAFPETDYTHVATLDIRRLEVTFSGPRETLLYDQFRTMSQARNERPGDLAKRFIAEFVTTVRKPLRAAEDHEEYRVERDDEHKR